MTTLRTIGCVVVRWFLVGAVLALAPNAYAADQAGASPPKVKDAVGKPAKLPPAPDAKTQAKVNAYVELMNHESKGVFEARDSWIEKLQDPRSGPNCKESYYSLPSSTGTYAQRYSEYRRQFGAKPKLDTDAVALQMVDALEELDGVYEQGRGIGNKKIAEACPKAKEIHPKLLAAWNKYGEGYDTLHAFVEKYNDELDQREVVSTEKKYGKNYRYHFARIVADSKGLLREIAQQQHKEDPDGAAIQAKADGLGELVKETKALIASAKPNPNYPYPPGLSLLISDSMPRFQSAVDDYIKLANDKAQKNRPKFLKAKWDYVVDKYNKLVDQMNSVAFDKKMK